jgi:hypothetical protein
VIAVKKTTVIGLAALVFGAPAGASAATIAPDPAKPCYREGETLFLNGTGYTPNTVVSFTRDGTPVPTTSPVVSDASGNFSSTLRLPSLTSGQLRLTYVGTDTVNAANVAQVQLLVSAVDVTLSPEDGAPNRLLTLTGRGFTTGRTLWAHIKRKGGRKARTMRLGRLKGACRTIRVKRRLFPPSPAFGEYRVQFDTFRRYRPSRAVKAGYDVNIVRTQQPAVAALSLASGR